MSFSRLARDDFDSFDQDGVLEGGAKRPPYPPPPPLTPLPRLPALFAARLELLAACMIFVLGFNVFFFCKVTSGFGIVRNLSLGADLCNSARGMMFALGCIQVRDSLCMCRIDGAISHAERDNEIKIERERERDGRAQAQK